MAVLIDGVKIKDTADIRVSPFEIKKTERTASGRLVADVVAVKRSVRIGYSMIWDTDLKKIMDLLSTGVFHQLTYPDVQKGEAHTITVCLDGTVDAQSWRRFGDRRVWKDVTIPLIER